MKTGEAVLVAGVGGLVGGLLVFMLTRTPAPIATVKPVSGTVPGGLSFPFLENKDRVDPVASPLY